MGHLAVTIILLPTHTISASNDSFFHTPAGQNNSDDSGVGENSAPNTPASSIDSMQNKFLSPEIKAEAYKAIDSYQADGPGQVSFDIGDTIHVLDKLEDGELVDMHVKTSSSLKDQPELKPYLHARTKQGSSYCRAVFGWTMCGNFNPIMGCSQTPMYRVFA